MFSLIITIISIALVAALAVATLYYGGSQFSQGSAKAQADQLISQAQQIAGANTLYSNDHGGSFDTTVSDLQSNNYLNSTPAVSSTLSSQAFALPGGSGANTVKLTLDQTTATAACTAVGKAVGSITSASQSTPNTTSNSAKQYDCWGTSGAYTFQFNG